MDRRGFLSGAISGSAALAAAQSEQQRGELIRSPATDCSTVACKCCKCTGCEEPPPPFPDECELPDDFIDGVFCHRCGRFAWCDHGNERLECPTTGEWLCSVCSNVDCLYP